MIKRVSLVRRKEGMSREVFLAHCMRPHADIVIPAWMRSPSKFIDRASVRVPFLVHPSRLAWAAARGASFGRAQRRPSWRLWLGLEIDRRPLFALFKLRFLYLDCTVIDDRSSHDDGASTRCHPARAKDLARHEVENIDRVYRNHGGAPRGNRHRTA